MHRLNFLGHYFFDHIPSHHAYNSGLVMPDMVRIFTGARLSRQMLDTLADSHALAGGSIQHMERDRHFHNSAYFRKTAEITASLFKKEGVSEAIPRSWFLAHVMNELMLDRVLQKEHSSLAASFYNDLEMLKSEDLTDFLQTAGVADPVLFQQRLARFREVRYLPAYLDNEKLIYSLNRIYFQAGMPEAWNPKQQHTLMNVIPAIETSIESHLPDLLSEMA